MRTALPLVLLAAACAPAGKNPSDPANPAGTELQISAHLDPASPDPIEGGLGLFAVSVRNGSKRIVILRDLTLADGTPVLTWENPPPKPLVYDSRLDEFRAEAGPRASGEGVHIGLLLPGEAILFRPQVRLLNLPRRYLLYYHSYTADEAARNVYFEHREGGLLRYRQVHSSDLEAMASAKAPEATHRSVVFPHARSPLETPRTAEVTLQADAPPRRFRLADALVRAGLTLPEVEESTFCVYLDGWAVRARGKSWLITPKGATPLPAITRFELCFFHLDMIDPHLGVQFEFTGALDVRFPDRRIVPLRDNQERMRKLAFIPREEVAAFLKDVAQKGLEVDVRFDGRAASLVLRAASDRSGSPSLPFGQALKKAGIASAEVVEHVWSEALEAWAIRTKSASWVVSERGGGGLPAIPWFAFFFRRLDELAAAGEARFEIPAELREAFPYAAEGAVKRSDLAKFLAEAKERDLTIDVLPAGSTVPFRLRR
ncbi:MAG TPA: hypothetical protein VK661_07060 [Planctomycetota bacterium]|nr:hypothetical protein [Planctomycetota bacterium]